MKGGRLAVAWCAVLLIIACSPTHVPADSPEECRPAKCGDPGALCGVVPDGCGGTLACGDCPRTPTCTPRTCEDLGAQCGPISDCCGGTIECGDCGAGQRCGDRHSGPSNLCVDVQRTHRWSATFPDYVAHIGFGEGGSVYVLTTAALVKLGPNGEHRWTRTHSGDTLPRALVSNDLGAWALLARCLGGCNVPGARPGLLVRYDPRGNVVWSREFGEVADGLALGSDGSVVAIVSQGTTGDERFASDIIRLDVAGNDIWRQPFRGARTAAIDQDGNVIVGGADLVPTEHAVRPFIAKLTPVGDLMWRRVFESAFGEVAVEVSGQGTIVAAVRFSGELSWAGDTFAHTSRPEDEAALVLIAAEPTGAELWSRFHRYGGFLVDLDVATSGDIALLVLQYCARFRRFNAAGEPLWAREVSDECKYRYTTGEAVYGLTVAASDNVTVVGGAFGGTHDFGDGPRSAPASDPSGFVLVFGP